MTKTYRIATDEENNAEEWWDALRESEGHDLAALVEALAQDDEIVVDEEQKNRLLSHFQALPGWTDADAPAYARHPVTVTEIDS